MRLSFVIRSCNQEGSPRARYDVKRPSFITLQAISLAKELAFSEERLKLTSCITCIAWEILSSWKRYIDHSKSFASVTITVDPWYNQSIAHMYQNAVHKDSIGTTKCKKAPPKSFSNWV